MQLVLADADARTQRHVAHRQFSGVGVRQADGGSQRHRRVRGHCVLDHQRVDVVTTTDDQVLDAASDVDAALLV